MFLNSGRWHNCTCVPILFANNAPPNSVSMKTRAWRCKITSSAPAGEYENYLHNHCADIPKPLIWDGGRITSKSSKHSSDQSMWHVPVIGGLWIRSPRIMTTSYEVMVIFPIGRWNICVLDRHCSTRLMINSQSSEMCLTWYTPHKPNYMTYEWIWGSISHSHMNVHKRNQYAYTKLSYKILYLDWIRT